MNVFQWGLLLICYIVTGYHVFRIINRFVNIKQNIFLKLISFISITLIFQSIIYIEDYFNISIMLLFFIVTILICYQGSIIEKVSCVLVLFPIMVSLNFISKHFICYIYYNYMTSSQEINKVIENLNVLVIFIFWVYIDRQVMSKLKHFNGILDYKSWLLIDVFCIAPFLSIYGAILFTQEAISLYVYIISIGCIITNLCIIVYASYLSGLIDIKTENLQMKLERSFYEKILKNQQEIRKLKHDMNHHLSVIATLLEQDKKEDAKIYFTSLTKQLETKGKIFTEHSVINAVLNAKYNDAIEQGIDTFFNIDIQGIIPIDDIDLCSLFSNTLENAIEACSYLSKDQKPFIKVKSRIYKGTFYYQIQNNYDGILVKKKNSIFTRKQDKNIHGIGIKSVQSLVNKYDGIIDIKTEENIFEVTVIIQTFRK